MVAYGQCHDLWLASGQTVHCWRNFETATPEKQEVESVSLPASKVRPSRGQEEPARGKRSLQEAKEKLARGKAYKGQNKACKRQKKSMQEAAAWQAGSFTSLDRSKGRGGTRYVSLEQLWDTPDNAARALK